MGLDMYAFKTKYEPEQPVDFKVPEGVEEFELHYWRKHPDLHGWMENLYEAKGGKEQFNCVNVQLTRMDLEKLKHDINDKDLPETQGFFFGKSFGDEKEDDLEFIESALEAIEQGYTVYYTSWW